jgi:hypothetical protein
MHAFLTLKAMLLHHYMSTDHKESDGALSFHRMGKGEGAERLEEGLGLRA